MEEDYDEEETSSGSNEEDEEEEYQEEEDNDDRGEEDGDDEDEDENATSSSHNFDGDDGNNEGEEPSTPLLVPSYYQQLGAPVLLYRNRESYSVQDVVDASQANAAVVDNPTVHPRQRGSYNDDMAAARTFHENQSSLYRGMARWYYPIDFHIIKPEKPSEKVQMMCQEWGIFNKKMKETAATDTATTATTANQKDDNSDAGNDKTEEEEDDDDEDDKEDSERTTEHNEENSDKLKTLLQLGQEQDMLDNDDEDEDDDDDDNEYREKEHEEAEEKHQAQEEIEDEGSTENRQQGQASSSTESPLKRLQNADNNKERVGWRAQRQKKPRQQAGPGPVTIQERNLALKRAFNTQDYDPDQIFPLQLQVRAHMLLAERDAMMRRMKLKLQAYTQLDANYVPTKCNPSKRGKLTTIMCRQTEMYDRERMNRADPAYLAPFELPSLQETAAEDIYARGCNLPNTTLKEVPAIAPDDINAPGTFGNCLLSFPCQCDVCQQNDDGKDPVPCLLHPVGPLQDRVRLSFLSLPHGRSIFQQVDPRLNVPEELQVDHRIKQLQQCGANMFLVRTSEHVTIFSIAFVKPRCRTPLGDGACWGSADLKVLHRIDCRTLHRSMPSYRPMDAACHPRYGVLSPAKVAVLYQSKSGQKNWIHHYQLGLSSLSVQKHNITNLKEISLIDFSSHHPMVIWAAAQSYVRPALTFGYHNTKAHPSVGYGSSLYSVDFRSPDSATFQWSPSAELYSPEGTHSISGISTDWECDHRLWVSSISASKTWEIDTRMPCESVNSWSLPHICDEPGSVLPVSGLFGVGNILCRPYRLLRSESNSHQRTRMPCLCVGLNPGSFGLHLYERPLQRPSFETKSIECANHQQASATTMSSVFALPDVSERIFTCGLAAFSTHTRNYFGKEATLRKEEAGVRDILSLLSITSKGDLYKHSLQRSTETSSRHNTGADDLSVRRRVVPMDSDTLAPVEVSWNTIRVSLSNEFPVPSHSVKHLACKGQSHSDLIDLSHFKTEKKLNKKDAGIDLSQPEEEEKRNSKGANTATGDAQVLDNGEGNMSHTNSSEGRRTWARASARIRRSTVSSTNPKLVLPSHLAPVDGAGNLQTFDGRKSVVETTMHEDTEFRSDITPNILGKVWSSDDNSSSDGSTY